MDARRRGGVVLGRHDLDTLRIELGAELGQILRLELIRDRERLQGRLVDGAELLGLVDERLEIKFSKVSQGGSLLSNHFFAGPFAVCPIRTRPAGPARFQTSSALSVFR
jgi:hypothetical protein